MVNAYRKAVWMGKRGKQERSISYIIIPIYGGDKFHIFVPAQGVTKNPGALRGAMYGKVPGKLSYLFGCADQFIKNRIPAQKI
jgi:hypothetical protein